MRSALLFAFCLLLAAWATYRTLETSIHLVATTEVVETTVQEGFQDVWDLRGAATAQGVGKRWRFLELVAKNPLKVTWMKFEGDDLLILLSGKGEVARLHDSQGPVDTLVQAAIIRVRMPADSRDWKSPLVLPLDGAIVVGNIPAVVPSMPSPLLTRATVVLRGMTFFEFNRGTYEAGRRELAPGDMFCASEGASCRDTAKLVRGRGFLYIRPESSIQVVADWLAGNGLVERYKATGYALNTSVFGRLHGDPYLLLLWAAFAGAWGIGRKLLDGKGAEHGS